MHNLYVYVHGIEYKKNHEKLRRENPRFESTARRVNY